MSDPTAAELFAQHPVLGEKVLGDEALVSDHPSGQGEGLSEDPDHVIVRGVADFFARRPTVGRDQGSAHKCTMTKLTLLAIVVCGLAACARYRHRTESDAGAVRAPDAASPPTQTMDASTDSSHPDAMSIMPPDAVDCFGDLPVMKVLDTSLGVAHDPDWSCVTQDLAEPSNSQTTQNLQFELISLTPAAIEGVTVDFFVNPSTLGRPYATRMFDGTSNLLSLDVPEGQPTLSIRVHALQRSDPMLSVSELREYGLPIRGSDQPAQGFMLLNSQRTLIANLAGRGVTDDDTEQAFLISYARDCSGHDVRGAQFELFDFNSGVVDGGTSARLPHPSYLQFGLPNPDCTFTSYDQAAWIMVNAPANANEQGLEHMARTLRVKGRMRESDSEPVVFGVVDLELVSGAITYVHIAPRIPHG